MKRRFTTWLVLVGLVLTSALCARTAAANGRFPRAQTILAAPGSDGTILYLRATFGLLISRDAGKTWRWACEEAMGFSGTWDPPVAVTKGGRIWVGLEKGLSYSDDGCSFTRVPELEGSTVRDLTTDAKGEEVLAITSTYRQFTYVWKRNKAGKFEKQGGGVDGIVALTFDAAPSKPERMYVTAQSDSLPDGRLFRSDDGGVRFHEVPTVLPTEAGEEPGRLYISLVDPQNPDHVVFRRLSNKGSDILVTTDGGKTLKRTHRMASAMFGFSRGPNPQTLFIGSGLPEHGILESTDKGEHFTKISNFGTLCLLSLGDKLYACNNELSGPVISLSTDHGKTWKPLAAWKDVEGPVACGDGGVCKKPWTELSPVLVPPAGDAGVIPSSTPSASGNPPGVDASTASADAGGTRPTPNKGGCGCREYGESTRIPLGFGGLLPLGVGAIALARRIRRDPG